MHNLSPWGWINYQSGTKLYQTTLRFTKLLTRVDPVSPRFTKSLLSYTKLHQSSPRFTKCHTKCHQGLPSFTKLHQALPSYTKVYQVTPSFTKTNQGLPSFTKLHQTTPSYTKFYKISPRITKLYQATPSFNKFHQGLPNFTKLHQALPNYTKVYQVPPSFTQLYQASHQGWPKFTNFTKRHQGSTFFEYEAAIHGWWWQALGVGQGSYWRPELPDKHLRSKDSQSNRFSGWAIDDYSWLNWRPLMAIDWMDYWLMTTDDSWPLNLK